MPFFVETGEIFAPSLLILNAFNRQLPLKAGDRRNILAMLTVFGLVNFSHVSGVHFQNIDTWDQYVGHLERGKLPISRALPVTDRQLLIRELILQLKTGRLDGAYFHNKFGVRITEVFAEAFECLHSEGFHTIVTSPFE